MNFVYLQLQASERSIMFCAHDLKNKWKNSDILYQFCRLYPLNAEPLLTLCLHQEILYTKDGLKSLTFQDKRFCKQPVI